MRLKIRCDGKCEKFCKIFGELNWAQVWKGVAFDQLSWPGESVHASAKPVPAQSDGVTFWSRNMGC